MNIEHAEHIAKLLHEKHNTRNVKIYTMNNMNQEREVERIASGEIIVATNLAGRGTDINTDEIEEYGGMHVLITFLPSNQRVEDQAFGRTSRQGKRGTGQMVLNESSLTNYGNIDITQIKEKRDQLESKQLEYFQKTELKIIQMKDRLLFGKFCPLMDKIRQNIREKFSLWREITNTVKSVAVNINEAITPVSSSKASFLTSIYEASMLASIEEQWAIFMLKVEDGKIKIEDAEQAYNKFHMNILNDYEHDAVIKNPYYHIVIANDLVVNDSYLNHQYDRALKHFEEALKLDKNCCSAAYAGKALLLIKAKKKISTLGSKNYKLEAIEALKSALEVSGDEIASISAIQILPAVSKNPKSDLSKQLVRKVNILGLYSTSLQNSLLTLKKSQRLIDVVVSTVYQSEVQCTSERGENIDREGYSVGKILEINTYIGAERGSSKLKKNLSHYKDSTHQKLGLVFHDLTVRQDSGEIDQARDTITQAFKEDDTSSFNYQLLNTIFQRSNALNEAKYYDIEVCSQGMIQAEQLLVLLNPDIDVRNATKDIAFMQLKENSSFFHMHLLPESWSPNSCMINLEIMNDDGELLRL